MEDKKKAIRWIGVAVAACVSSCSALAMLPVLILGAGGLTSGCAALSEAPGGAATAPIDPAELAAAQTRNARTIVATGEQMTVSEFGIVVALAVASQESALRNLANDGTGKLRPEQQGVSQSLQMAHEGVGNDHGSVGVFQQQFPYWGSLAELMDPQQASMKFFEALLKVPGWESMTVSVAAQTVQVSKYPDAYTDDEPLARRLYTENKGAGANAKPLPRAADTAGRAASTTTSEDSSDVLCGGGSAMNCPATNNPAEQGLTSDGMRVFRCLAQHFPIKRWSTIGDRPSVVDRDHQEGRAVDAMIDDYTSTSGRALGDKIAAWVIENADALGVKYVIWHDQIWTRNGEGTPGHWDPYTNATGDTGDTAQHRDHVHVSVYGNAAGTAGGGAAHGGDGVRLPIDEGKYVLSSTFGPRWGTFHAGVDFAAAEGVPIYAVTGGTVTAAGFNGCGTGYGNCVLIKDGNTETLYAHQVDGGIKVQAGDTVTAGALIGAVGTTGDSTGNHLHYEVRRDGRAIDPLPYLAEMGLTPKQEQ
ncbi:M23 family metallopeptidase [Nocardia sp. NPDC051030]|uniref:M23 family metallopeptidase n=1 Tax=Nocardia sp. NPDC051030 TaxID=3155162 RepID=UPI0034181DE2